MAVTARTWVSGEFVTAAKMNTIRDDILELNAVAGFENTQYGSITIPDGSASSTATVSATSSRAFLMDLHAVRSDGSAAGGYTLARTNPTTITATRTGTGGGTSLTVNFCIADPRG